MAAAGEAAREVVVPAQLHARLEDALVHQLTVHGAQLTGVEDEAAEGGQLQGNHTLLY